MCQVCLVWKMDRENTQRNRPNNRWNALLSFKFRSVWSQPVFALSASAPSLFLLGAVGVEEGRGGGQNFPMSNLI